MLQGLAQSRHLGDHVLASFLVESLDDLDGTLAKAFEAAKRGPVRIDVSFPLLFDLVPHLLTGSEPAPLPTPLAGVLITEEIAKDEGWYAHLFPEKDGLWLVPGIEREGHGLPYALGARIARPDVPMALVTSPQSLLSALDCVGLARSLGIVVHVVEQDTGSGIPLREAVRIFGADHHWLSSVAQVRNLVYEDQNAWTIVCGAAPTITASSR